MQDNSSTWIMTFVQCFTMRVRLDGGYNINTDNLVGVSSEKSRAIGAPSQTGTMRHSARSSTFLIKNFKGPQSINNDLGFQIPNLDTFISSGAQPVPVGREDQRVNDLASVERVKALALVQIPKHGGPVLAT